MILPFVRILEKCHISMPKWAMEKDLLDGVVPILQLPDLALKAFVSAWQCEHLSSMR